MKWDEALLFFALLCFAWYMGVRYERHVSLKPCIYEPRKPHAYPAAKTDLRRMSKYLEGRTQ